MDDRKKFINEKWSESGVFLGHAEFSPEEIKTKKRYALEKRAEHLKGLRGEVKKRTGWDCCGICETPIDCADLQRCAIHAKMKPLIDRIRKLVMTALSLIILGSFLIMGAALVIEAGLRNAQ